MKLSNANLEKVMVLCTKKEIDLILHIGQFQDEYGCIAGIDYKDVMKAINICKSTFYTLLYGLEEKGLIHIDYFNEYGYWAVQITNNVFANAEDYKKGYLNLNYEILHSQAFMNLTKSEKIIVLHLLKINDYRKAKIKITFRKIMEWTGKSQRSAKKFIHTLSSVLKIVVEDTICLIDCLFNLSARKSGEVNTKNRHLIDYRLKKARCHAAEIDIKDTLVVLKQYSINKMDKIMKLLDTVIANFGTLVPRYMNKIAFQYQ